jgi:SAM-dependent methyltransferase
MRSVFASLPGVARLKRRRHWFAEQRAFRAEFEAFGQLAQAAGGRFALKWEDRWACLHDRTPATSFDTHYVYHCAWAVRVVAGIHPDFHVDIASSLHFCAQLSAFIPVQFYDYRPAALHLPGLTTGAANLTALSFASGSIRSLSCMHVVEHIGLGRYGDPLDPDGDLKAMAELTRVLAPGGSLLFVVPVGQARIQFNAHRIYAFQQIRDGFADLDLVEFSLVPDGDDVGLIAHADPALVERQKYGCGCFWFRKRP